MQFKNLQLSNLEFTCAYKQIYSRHLTNSVLVAITKHKVALSSLFNLFSRYIK